MKVKYYYKQYQHEWYIKNKERKIKEAKEHYYKNRSHKLLNIKHKNAQNRIDLLVKLGSFCKNCGETRMALLQLDHIHNDGEIDRKRFQTTSIMVTFYLKHMDLAKIVLQPLCANCNWLKRQQNLGFELMNDAKFFEKNDL